MPFLGAVLVGVLVLVAGWPRPAHGFPGSILALPTAEGKGHGRRRHLKQPFWLRLIPFWFETALRRWRLERLVGPDVLAKQLAYADVDAIISPEQFLCLRVIVPLSLGLALFAIYLSDPAPFRLMLVVVGTGVGIMLPDHWLKQKVKQQQQTIRQELPAILTTLAVLLDSGLNLLPAVQEIVERKQGVLTQKLGIAMQQTRMGTPVQDALFDVAQECGVQELTVFVSVLGQAMKKGAGGISEAVRGQALQMWAIRQQRVEEKGQEMTQDLFFILLLLAFPAMALFLLGPVGLSLYNLFFKGGMGS